MPFKFKEGQHKGISLIELLLSIVVIGVAFTGMFSLVLTVNKHNVTPAINWQMSVIADYVLRSTVLEKTGMIILKESFPDLAHVLPHPDNYKIELTVEKTPYPGVNKKQVRVRHDQGGVIVLTCLGIN